MGVLSNPEIVAAIVGGIGAVVATVIAGLRALFKKIEEIMTEFKPNGGSSLKDQVNRIEQDYKTLSAKVENIYNILIKGPGKL